MTLYLLDADCVILAFDGARFPDLRRRIEQEEPGSVGVSAITVAEVALGSVNGKPPMPDLLDRFLTQIVVLPFDAAAARSYARLPFLRARFDRLVAAHALSIGAVVVTNNEGDFADIAGLRVENWTLPQ